MSKINQAGAQTATLEKPEAPPKGVKVRMLTSMAGDRWSVDPGAIVLHPESRTAQLFIAKGIAEECDQAIPHTATYHAPAPAPRERR